MIELAQNIITSKAGDRAVIALADGVESVILNPVGTLLWERLNEASVPLAAQSLASYLCETFPGLSPERAMEDVGKFLEKMAKHRLVSHHDCD